jgi:multidrug efflux pump subunit AcrA (membrane-fusion protein)
MKYLSIPSILKSKQTVLSTTFIAVAALASVSIFATGPSAAPAQRVERAWPVSAVEIAPQTLRPSFSAFGKLESNKVARLRSGLVAEIAHVHVREGDWVGAGEILVELDDREVRLRLLERKAELAQQEARLRSMQTELTLARDTAEHFKSRNQVAQAKLQRHQDLFQKRLISKSLLDEVTSLADQASIEYRNQARVLADLPNQIGASEANVDRARALVEQTELDLAKTKIKAPFAGPVLTVHAAPGDYNNLSTPLVELAATDGYEVRVHVPDAYAETFSEAIRNVPDCITASSDDGTRLTLVRLAGQVQAGQTGLDAFFTFVDGNDVPALGQVFNITVSLPAEEALVALPVQSLYDSSRVYSVQDSRLVGHKVERIGERETVEGYEVLVRSAELVTGDRVITTQLPKAITGLLVDVANDGEAKPG